MDRLRLMPRAGWPAPLRAALAKTTQQVLGQIHKASGNSGAVQMDSRLGLAIDVSCGARVTRAKEKWRRSSPCEQREARRLDTAPL
jgi:hypothetical protein